MHPDQTPSSVVAPDPGARLLSTGIPALDQRLGGLVRARHYVLNGPSGAGKSSASLQFLGCGLTAGETCLLLTQDDPGDVLAQGEFLGFDFRAAAARNQLIVLQFRLDFARSYARAAEPERVFDELRQTIAEFQPSRLVMDSLSPFLEGGAVTEEALSALPAFLDELRCTTYLTVPGDLNDSHYGRLYDRAVANAAGIFHFASVEGQVRELTIRKLRQPVNSTAPLQFVFRQGIGIVAHEASRHGSQLPEEVRRRIVFLNLGSGTELPEEVRDALEHSYDLAHYRSFEGAFAELAAARFGVLLLALDPRATEAAFQLTRELRRSGNGAPILFVAPHHGLRGSTRARGLRAGGDDFLTDALSPEEFVERIQAASERGHRRTSAETELQPLFLQPAGAGGELSLLGEAEFRGVLVQKLRSTASPFFALALLHPYNGDASAAWQILRNSLRVTEGDLGAQLDDGRVALYLHDVRRRHVDSLLQRITAAHPQLGSIDAFEVFTYPSDRHEVEVWLHLSEAPASRVA